MDCGAERGNAEGGAVEMKGKQTDLMEEIDRFQIERERREKEAMIRHLDDTYGRMDWRRLKDCGYPAGTVVIIGQELFRNGRTTMHFYRTVLNYARTMNDPRKAVFVEDTNEEFPERPPWAETVGHEGELKDIEYFPHHIHWATGEVAEPIVTWWMKKWGMLADD